MFRDDFEGAELDRSVWLPHYLPAWSSKEATKAEYRLQDSTLELTIPPGHPRWCEDEHPEPLRVSGVQSGNFSGPVGSPIGQQRFRDGLLVREEQVRFEGWLPSSGRVAVRCRMSLSPRSMAAMWLAGFEERPEDGGELCVVEVFGRSIKDGSAEIGVGVKQVNDTRLTHDFVAPRLAIEVADYHTYEVEWDDVRAVFSVDGAQTHVCRNPPVYPMQVMLAVFDFPGWSGREDHVPSLTVDWVEGST
jgi:Glycosyl hydrolases family 16